MIDLKKMTIKEYYKFLKKFSKAHIDMSIDTKSFDNLASNKDSSCINRKVSTTRPQYKLSLDYLTQKIWDSDPENEHEYSGNKGFIKYTLQWLVKNNMLKDVCQPVWFDIETAPRDGTKIIIPNGKKIRLAYFENGKWCAYGGGPFDEPEKWFPVPAHNIN